MAASFLFGRATFRGFKGLVKAYAPTITYCNKRFLLSQAYSCREAWSKRLEDPVFSKLPLSEFAIQLRDQYDKQKLISAVDMEILANKLHEMDVDEAEFMEDIMRKFRKSPASNPVQDSIVYVIVRNYIDNNMADRLLPLMQTRSQTGIFPDSFAFSLLLDHFLVERDFASAAQVAYQLMLQEDFSHPTSRLLALSAAVQHLESVTLDDLAPGEIKDAEGEEDWIPVKYIRHPAYDDHFDVKAQQYLLGKTLYVLGKELGPTSTTLGVSLQVSGLALYHKFARCLQLLRGVADSASADGSVVVLQSCLTHLEESLARVQIRDPDKPQKETGLLTADDEIYKLLPTLEERDGFVSQAQQLRQTLQDKGRLVEEKLSALTEALVSAQLSQHEAADIEVQTERLEAWRAERQEWLRQQLYDLEKRQKAEEVAATLKELQEKEEMLRFFELHDQIRLIQPKRLPKEKVVEAEEDEEVLRAKRIKRRKYRHHV